MNHPGHVSSLTRQPLPIRRRADLVVVETKHRNESAHVIKDPVAMKYHRLRPDEYFVLSRLDGTQSLDSIRQAYQQRYAPTKVSAAELNQLLFRFHQLGLTLSDSALQGESLFQSRDQQRRKKRMQLFSSVLFIRFPGVDPEPLLKRLYPLVRPALGRLGILAYVILVAIGIIGLAIHSDRFAAQLPTIDAWLTVRSVLILGLVIGMTKVLHELGHAIACKHFGGECHQIGPMLLVFTPALYCDTSDSWMLPSRWARAAVGLAGIAVEVGLASLATILWFSTGEGLVHTIAMNVMIVCSISTVVFNANPLLRYDGYYVLSDLWDVPNLGERSKKVLSVAANRFLWGIEEPSPESHSKWQSRGLLAYAITAAAYRWFLTLTILYLVTIMLRPYRLESIGRLLAGFATGGMLFLLLRPVYQFFSHPGRRRKIHMKPTLRSALGIAVILGLFWFPFPSWISVNGRIVPRAETPLYLASEGKLETLFVRPGDRVEAGAEIARLSNPETSLQWIAAKGRYETQKTKVDSIIADAMHNADAASDLPGQRALLAELKSQYERRKARVDGLMLTSPASGKLIAGPQVNRQPVAADDLTLVRWSGSPTDSINQACWLEAGTELMALQTDLNHDAELILDQLQVRRLQIGSEVKLIARNAPSQILRGRVREIATTDYDVQINGSRRDDPQARERMSPPGTNYLVRVELDNSEDLKPDMRVEGAIAAAPRSIIARIHETLTSLLRFR